MSSLVDGPCAICAASTERLGDVFSPPSKLSNGAKVTSTSGRSPVIQHGFAFGSAIGGSSIAEARKAGRSSESSTGGTWSVRWLACPSRRVGALQRWRRTVLAGPTGQVWQVCNRTWAMGSLPPSTACSAPSRIYWSRTGLKTGSKRNTAWPRLTVMNRVLATLTVALMAVASAACASHATAPDVGASSAPTASSAATAPPTRQTSPASSPSAVASPGVIANCPAKVRNVSGAYAFLCPDGWLYVNCEQSPFIMPYTWLINPGGCSQEGYGVRMMVWSQQGLHSAAENTYLGQPQSSQSVIVAGVSGTRRMYLVTAANPLPPPKGTAQVIYTFLTGGRTYVALYDRYPGDRDLTADFDQMVTTGLRFSASG